MTEPPAKMIFLTGAPERTSLYWDDDELLSSFIAPVRRFLGEEVKDDPNADLHTSQVLPRWRQISVPARKDQVSKAVVADPKATRFWSTQNYDNEGKEHLDFLEHSLLALQNLESSQIEPPEGSLLDETTFTTTTSIDATLSTDASLTTSSDSLVTYSSDQPKKQIVSFSGLVTDLKRIPHARYILSISPQTMTVNVLASIISIQPVRTVRTRRNNVEMDIIEVLLGDETKAGFSVSFWLPAADSQYAQQNPQRDGFRAILSALRNGDVVLVTHVALNEFRGNVYGQSLSRRTTRNNTTVTVLSDNVTGLGVSTMAKADRVRQWAATFVGRKRAPSPTLLHGEGQKRQRAIDLPPDSQ